MGDRVPAVSKRWAVLLTTRRRGSLLRISRCSVRRGTAFSQAASNSGLRRTSRSMMMGQVVLKTSAAAQSSVPKTLSKRIAPGAKRHTPRTRLRPRSVARSTCAAICCGVYSDQAG